ncbi:MAG: hypothetical protein OEW72_02495 [Gammaproteobacteria bacterium]|nr:hypothetical protein [Gammaproteobacteria bacterium]
MTGSGHNSGAPAGVGHDQVLPDPVLVAAQRRQARRAALLLGIVALCVYLGFILATGLRN